MSIPHPILLLQALEPNHLEDASQTAPCPISLSYVALRVWEIPLTMHNRSRQYRSHSREVPGHGFSHSQSNRLHQMRPCSAGYQWICGSRRKVNIPSFTMCVSVMAEDRCCHTSLMYTFWFVVCSVFGRNASCGLGS